MEKFEDYLNKKCQFFKERLGHLNCEQFFNASVVNVAPGVFKDSDSYKLIEGVLAKKERFEDKIDRLLLQGLSALGSILSPGKKEDCSYFLVGKIYFSSSPKMIGEIDFMQKFVGKTKVKEFSVCSYRITHGGNHKMVEISTDWDGGITLVCLSILDFERNPDLFVKERILNWQEESNKVQKKIHMSHLSHSH